MKYLSFIINHHFLIVPNYLVHKLVELHGKDGVRSVFKRRLGRNHLFASQTTVKVMPEEMPLDHNRPSGTDNVEQPNGAQAESTELRRELGSIAKPTG